MGREARRRRDQRGLSFVRCLPQWPADALCESNSPRHQESQRGIRRISHAARRKSVSDSRFDHERRGGFHRTGRGGARNSGTDSHQRRRSHFDRRAWKTGTSHRPNARAYRLQLDDRRTRHDRSRKTIRHRHRVQWRAGRIRRRPASGSTARHDRDEEHLCRRAEDQRVVARRGRDHTDRFAMRPVRQSDRSARQRENQRSRSHRCGLSSQRRDDCIRSRPTCRSDESARAMCAVKAVTLPKDADDAMLRFGTREVRLTNLRKLFWKKLKITKRDLLQYYADISPWLLPHLVDRAMVMKRYPNGAEGDLFYMKRAPEPRPEWIEICEIPHSEGIVNFPMIQDLPSLMWVINLGCIDLNPWYARCDDWDRPDALQLA